jgi:hypothetical protein
MPIRYRYCLMKRPEPHPCPALRIFPGFPAENRADTTRNVGPRLPESDQRIRAGLLDPGVVASNDCSFSLRCIGCPRRFGAAYSRDTAEHKNVKLITSKRTEIDTIVKQVRLARSLDEPWLTLRPLLGIASRMAMRGGLSLYPGCFAFPPWHRSPNPANNRPNIQGNTTQAPVARRERS